VILMLADRSTAQEQPRPRAPFMVGEVLRYKVKWTFFRLGTVTIRQLSANSSDPTQFLLEMSVQSNPSLPFIDVNFLHQTHLTTASQCLVRETIISGEDPSERTLYWYDAASQQIFMVDSAGGKLTRRDSLLIKAPCYDALGLLMRSRGLSGSGISLTMPTLNDYEIKPTEITFPNEVEEIEVAALDRPIRARRVEGTAKWVGRSFAGMSGPFRAWVSDDEAAVPLKANVEIFLGSIILELESFERPGWSRDSKFAQIPEEQRKEELER